MKDHDLITDRVIEIIRAIVSSLRDNGADLYSSHVDGSLLYDKLKAEIEARLGDDYRKEEVDLALKVLATITDADSNR